MDNIVMTPVMRRPARGVRVALRGGMTQREQPNSERGFLEFAQRPAAFVPCGAEMQRAPRAHKQDKRRVSKASKLSRLRHFASR